VLKQILDDYRTLWREPIFYLTLVCVVILLLMHFMGETRAASLEFHRERIFGGEWWRLFSGNFVHFGLYHTNMNCAGFAAVVLILFRDVPMRVLLLGLVLIPLGVGGGLLLSQVDIYRGYSGCNYGLLAFGLLLGLRHNCRLYALALLILGGKIAMEQMPGYDVDYLRDEIGVAVAVESHLSGFCTGLALGMLLLIGRRARGARPEPE
jgi:rhomboid family GlyGly-CTERM serine protease